MPWGMAVGHWGMTLAELTRDKAVGSPNYHMQRATPHMHTPGPTACSPLVGAPKGRL